MNANQPSEVAISAQGLSKLFLLYKKPQDRLKQSIFGRLGRNYAQTFWALRNVSFEVNRGEALGIIGRNGSGKSTLLQILSGTLQPTEGQFSTHGRLTALLELGAGFNTEFTGRENILLNGTTLGIPEREMRQLSAKVIDFAQIGNFIDQPVKIYSSGMFIRLAFSIATAVDPDILIIDEALAVGDMGFVFKCMNRMKQMRQQGATVILVTHDIQTVRSFCDKAIWLKDGLVAMSGTPLDVTSQYVQFLFEEQDSLSRNDVPPHLYDQYSTTTPNQKDQRHFSFEDRTDLVRWGNGEVTLQQFSIQQAGLPQENVFEYGKTLQLLVTARANKNISSGDLGMGFAFRNNKGLDIITSTTLEQNHKIPPIKAGQQIRVTFELPNILAPGDYALVLNIEDRALGAPQYCDFIENALIFKVVSTFPIYSQVLPDVWQNIQIIEQTSDDK